MEDYRESGRDEQLAGQAGERAGGIVATVVVWYRSEDGGTVARLRVTDGRDGAWVEVMVPSGTMTPFSSAIEWSIEELAGSLPDDSRYEALEARSPLAWTGTGVAG